MHRVESCPLWGGAFFVERSDEMKPDVVIMNFTGVYRFEQFARKKDFHIVDCLRIAGTDCYCDPSAAEELRRKIDACSPHGIHFMDSGDYHYVTKFWTDKIREPFSLLVFDHHPDMQAPLFDGVLSCGGWVKTMLDENPLLGEVTIVGADEHLIEEVDPKYRSRVHFYGERDLRDATAWCRFARERESLPVYVSIDKDVLDRQAVITNWDQGSLSLCGLERLLGEVLDRDRVIGIDICGECTPLSDLFLEKEEASVDNRANQSLLDFLVRKAG